MYATGGKDGACEGSVGHCEKYPHASADVELLADLLELLDQRTHQQFEQLRVRVSDLEDEVQRLRTEAGRQ